MPEQEIDPRTLNAEQYAFYAAGFTSAYLNVKEVAEKCGAGFDQGMILLSLERGADLRVSFARSLAQREADQAQQADSLDHLTPGEAKWVSELDAAAVNGSREIQRLTAERNRIARELADLRDDHDSLRERHAEFAETCTSHSLDRAAEQVAAEQLVERLENLDTGEAVKAAVRDYKAEITRIEGI
jgi:hypothetical protein